LKSLQTNGFAKKKKIIINQGKEMKGTKV